MGQRTDALEPEALVFMQDITVMEAYVLAAHELRRVKFAPDDTIRGIKHVLEIVDIDLDIGIMGESKGRSEAGHRIF